MITVYILIGLIVGIVLGILGVYSFMKYFVHIR